MWRKWLTRLQCNFFGHILVGSSCRCLRPECDFKLDHIFGPNETCLRCHAELSITGIRGLPTAFIAKIRTKKKD